MLNLTSGLGSFGKATVKCTTYAISKVALNMGCMHLAAAEEVVRGGVRVVVVDPGWVSTWFLFNLYQPLPRCWV